MNFWSQCPGTSHPLFLSCLWCLFGICIRQNLFNVQDIGLNGKAEYFISRGVIYSLPWQRLIFFSQNGLFYMDDLFGCFYAYVCWKLKSKTLLLLLKANWHSLLGYSAHYLCQDNLKLLPSTWWWDFSIAGMQCIIGRVLPGQMFQNPLSQC